MSFFGQKQKRGDRHFDVFWSKRRRPNGLFATASFAGGHYFSPHPATEMVTAVGGLDEVDMVGNTKTERGEEEEGKKKQAPPLSLFSSSLEERVKKTPRRGRSVGRIVCSVFSSLFFLCDPIAPKRGEKAQAFLLLTSRAAPSIQSTGIQRRKKQKADMTTAPTAAAPLSFAAAAGSATSDGPLKTVQIEGHVLLKILKHCAECAPSLVTGQLLGLDVGTTLEVTEAFPFPVRDGDDSDGPWDRSSFRRFLLGLLSPLQAYACLILPP